MNNAKWWSVRILPESDNDALVDIHSSQYDSTIRKAIIIGFELLHLRCVYSNDVSKITTFTFPNDFWREDRYRLQLLQLQAALQLAQASTPAVERLQLQATLKLVRIPAEDYVINVEEVNVRSTQFLLISACDTRSTEY